MCNETSSSLHLKSTSPLPIDVAGVRLSYHHCDSFKILNNRFNPPFMFNRHQIYDSDALAIVLDDCCRYSQLLEGSTEIMTPPTNVTAIPANGGELRGGEGGGRHGHFMNKPDLSEQSGVACMILQKGRRTLSTLNPIQVHDSKSLVNSTSA